jgi:hypothetical protein
MKEVSEVADRYGRFLAEQSAAWTDVLTLLEGLRNAFLRHQEDPPQGGSFREGVRLFAEAVRALFLDTHEQYERCRPSRRALSAIEWLDSVLGIDAALRRARIDGAMQLLLARASLRLRDPWVIYCSAKQRQAAGKERADLHTGEWADWLVAVDRDKRAAEEVLARYRNWFAEAATEHPETKPSRRRTEIYRRNLAFWWRRQRAVAASLDSEARLTRMILESLEITARTLDDLRAEREDLRLAVRGQIEYLSRWQGGTYSPPDMDARIASPGERLEAWQSRIDRAIEIRLPARVETTEPRSAFPSIRNRWRMIKPRKAYRDALLQCARPALASGLEAATEQNLALARDMERASEVILFAQAAARESAEGLLSEAVLNATTLLDHSDRATPADTMELDSAVRAALITAGRDAGAVLEVGRAGVLALMTRRQGRRLLRTSRSMTRQLAGQAATQVGAFFSRLAAAIQIKLGWRLPTRLPVPPVVHRIHLREAMDLEAAARELPALYRRLFRLSPVEDPRFLIGREEEMQGFQQALETWRDGRFAACLLVGARGSGKTSLLNCAVSGLFHGEDVIRAQFMDRLTEPEQMDDFVRGLPGSRRVVILEEIERTFLKSFDGFGAIRCLQQLIQSTASSTLWILGMNDFAFQLLDQALGLGAIFSHRINAMSVLQDDLVKAILQRHNLSGLRLTFAPPPPGDPRINRIRSFFGITDDAQKLFFDSLYEQSAGIFRSAFELWQSSIHRVEAGKVEMKQPLAPDFSPLRRELDQLDHFSLLSIQQHGSLTEEELSRVLMEPARASRLRLERLAALDIVAPDPDHGGLRVRPEAQLFVNDLLQRMNLI